MGSIKKFNLNRIIKEYNTAYFFETGTWKGDGVAYAAQSPFKKILSSEIIPEIADKAVERFKKDDRVTIITGNSTDVLNNHIGKLDGNCVFWLDAHFPGAEEGLNKYNDFEDEKIKLPLQEEIRLIREKRQQFQDVILIDDLRIYEEGPYKSGNLPENVLPPKIRNVNFLRDYFGNTHVIIKSYENEGYALLFPKENYHKHNQGLLNSLRSFYLNARHKIY
jgi:hypothetical protein